MKKYFRVKFGYGKQDYVSVDELDLQKAVYSMFAHKPVQIGDVFVQGDKIISITPHYHKYTGWNEFYEPREPEDFLQIKRDCPDFEGYVEATKNHVAMLMQNGRVNEIGKEEVIMLEKPKELLDVVKMLSDNFKIEK